MRWAVLGILGVSALALGACVPRVNIDTTEAASLGGPPLKAPARLDCPEREGALSRTGQAADGRSCDYDNGAGETVRLSLVALDGRAPAEAMAPARAALTTLVPLRVRHVAPVANDDWGEHTDLDMPFFHVHEHGDRSEVRIFGVKVNSEGDYADVRTGLGRRHTIVHAGPDGAEVVSDEVGRAGASLVYVRASEKRSASPYRAVGYVAKGPVEGPLVVAEFRDTHHRRHHEDGDRGDIGRLIDRNLED